MKERGVIQETLALFTIFSSAFLLLALLSHHPSDPSLTHYVTSTEGVKNWGGILGAVLSDLLMKTFGLLSYGLTILLGIAAGLWLGGIHPKGKVQWPIGLMLSALGLSILLGDKAGGLGSSLQGFVVSYGSKTGCWVVSLFLLSLAFRVLSGRHVFVLLKWAKIGHFSPLKSGLKFGHRKVLQSRSMRPPKIVMPSEEEPSAVSKVKVFSQQEVKDRLTQQRELTNGSGWILPSLEMLEGGKRQKVSISEAQLWSTAQLLEHKLRDFGVEGKVVEVRPGPVVTVYEFEPAPGVKISKIVNLEDDLALALSAYSVRIEAPIPGKSVVGIEVSNPVRETVYLKEILASDAFMESPSKLTLALGKDIQGRPFVIDLTKMPHLLVAGSTGSGKSVSMNCMIVSVLFRATPDEVKFLLIDPKMLEMSAYEDIPHLLLPVVTDPKEASSALRWVVREMEERYSLMASKGTKHIERYNQKLLAEGKEGLLPYIVVMIDELADLMITSRREVEESIIRLAQMARAAGIHLVLATQRPSVDVITGLIKANFPARISFQVSSKVDSRTILDSTGAEHLLGQGDMLFLPPGSSRLKRVHGAYVSEEEIKRVAEFWKGQGQPRYNLDILKEEPKETETLPDYDDPKYEEAVHYVIQTGQASVSALQRRFKIGYNRAARLIERMEREGIVGPSDGVRPRPVLVKRP